MTVAILSIGSELVRGEIVDTNAAWLAAELTRSGFNIVEVSVVDDQRESIVEAVRRLARSHGIVIATGGLGPTTDDLTALAAAHAAGVTLERNEGALIAIRRRVEARGKSVNAGHEKQAEVPAGSDVLPNAAGTAPGFAVRIGEASVFFLPGVPREMMRMFSDQVLPRIRSLAPNDTFQVRLRTYGLSESRIGQLLDGIEQSHAGIALGYRVHFPEVDVKVRARHGSYDAARTLASSVAVEIRRRLGDAVYGEGDHDFAEAVGDTLRARRWRLALAESCTGGLIGHLMTTYPASDYLVGCVVTYSNAAKAKLLGVSEDTLCAHGAVSAEVAAEMAAGARRAFECDVGLAVTGIAGPTGATATKPVGLCYWAVAHPAGTIVRERVFVGDRGEVQLGAAYAALELLRRTAKDLNAG